MNGYEQNRFIQNLINNIAFPFETKDIEKVISFYRLGTVKHGYRKGATTFPFIDLVGNVRAIQVLIYRLLHSIVEFLNGYRRTMRIETKVSCFSHLNTTPLRL